MTATERQGRWRKRRKVGETVAPLVVGRVVVDELLALRLIKVDDIGDPQRLGEAALEALLQYFRTRR